MDCLIVLNSDLIESDYPLIWPVRDKSYVTVANHMFLSSNCSIKLSKFYPDPTFYHIQ